MKICTKCKVEKPRSEFYTHTRGIYSKCKSCDAIQKVEWRKKNPDKRKAHQRKAKYGITDAEYKAMLERQDNKCVICRADFSNTKSLVDHCHDTDKFRGILCYCCNNWIGLLKDSTILLQTAINYLKNST